MVEAPNAFNTHDSGGGPRAASARLTPARRRLPGGGYVDRADARLRRRPFV